MLTLVLLIGVLAAFAVTVRAYAPKVCTGLPQLGMALFTPGPMVGAVSGRVGGTIFSHNRGGAYIRNGVVPTRVVSTYTELVRNALAACSRAWGSLTDEERLNWAAYTVENPVVNRLGQKKTLSGHMAYNALNARLVQAGDTPIDVPPNADSPAALATLSAVVDASTPSAVLTFTATPLSASERLMVFGCVVNKPGVNYVANKFKLLNYSDKAQATGLDVIGDLANRFGAVQAGDRVFFRVQVLDTLTGLVSGFKSTEVTVQA